MTLRHVGEGVSVADVRKHSMHPNPALLSSPLNPHRGHSVMTIPFHAKEVCVIKEIKMAFPADLSRHPCRAFFFLFFFFKHLCLPGLLGYCVDVSASSAPAGAAAK